MKDQQKLQKELNFGNWVPLKMIILPAVLALIFFGLALLRWPFLIAGLFFGIISLYFGLAYRLFSPHGGDLQERVQALLVENIECPRDKPLKVLDIGCGNGPLSIIAARRFSNAHVVGTDYWGKNWDYSIDVCNTNAGIAGVADRVEFRQADAQKLPFENDRFDLVVSNFVFHEIRGVKDKRAPLREALRVLKPGGRFVFQDLFLLQPYFGTPQELQETLREWGVSQVEFIPTHTRDFIPRFVKLPFMLGTMAILRGVKLLLAEANCKNLV